MRTFYFFAVFLIIGLSAKAQITLTAAANGVTTGTTSSIHLADTTGFTTGNAGTGQTWNYSNLVIQGSAYNTDYINPATTPYAASFSSTNVSASDGSGIYDYYLQTSNSTSYYGNDDGLSSLIFSDPEVQLTFPFTYGSTNTDNFVANNSSVTTTGTITITGDGTGILILPSGSYNVLRVKKVETEQQVIGATTYNTTITTYMWFSATERFPILQAYSSITNIPYYPNNKVLIVNGDVVGIEKYSNSNTLQVFPNPTQGYFKVNITKNGKTSKLKELAVTDLLGKVIWQTGASSNNAFDVDITNYSQGIYYVRSINEDGEIEVQKLVKQ